MSSSSTLRLSYYNHVHGRPISSSSTTSPNSTTAGLLSSSSPLLFSSSSTSSSGVATVLPPTTMTSSSSSSVSPTMTSSRRTHHSHARPPPPAMSDARERKAHAKKLLKKFPVISPESFGRVRKFCPICLDLLTSATITKTACNHFVHRSCLLKRLADDPTSPCPSCRVPIKPPRASKKSGSGASKGHRTAKTLDVGGVGTGVGAPLQGFGPIETFP